MTSIMCWCTHGDGVESLRALDLPRPSDRWEPSDAGLCVRLLQMATVSGERSLEHVDAIRIHDTTRPGVVALEVETNAGVAVTESIRVPALVLAWLDELADSFRSRTRDTWTVDPMTVAVAN